MDYTNLIIGIFAAGFGGYSAYLRITNKVSSSEKLKEMKARFGEGAGNTLHIVAYMVMPLVVGGVLILSSL
jgi:hypothetical protein